MIKLENFEILLSEKRKIKTNLNLEKQDFCILYAKEESGDALIFLRSLATLHYPLSGSYFFNKQLLDYQDYRNLLGVKKQIAYIIRNSSQMLWTKSFEANLLFMKEYFNKDSKKANLLTLDDDVKRLCTIFSLDEILEKKVMKISEEQREKGIFIRELSKKPSLILLDLTKKFIKKNAEEIFNELLRHQNQSAIVMRYHPLLEKYKKFFNKQINITDDQILIENVN